MSRAIFTVARGKPKYGEMAIGLARSLENLGDTTPRAILTDLPGNWDKHFDIVLRPFEPRSALDKLKGAELLDADQIIALDCDSLAFKKLDSVFDRCAGKPFVIQGDRHSSGVWHGANVEEICRRYGVDSLPRFNGGFLYYERGPKLSELVQTMQDVERNYRESGFAEFRGNASEEVCILLAMLRTGLGDLVPDECDFVSTAVGLVGRLNMDVKNSECSFLCRRSRLRLVRPTIFHASRYSNFFIYWRQLDRLADLAGEPREHPAVSATRAALQQLLSIRSKPA